MFLLHNKQSVTPLLPTHFPHAQTHILAPLGTAQGGHQHSNSPRGDIKGEEFGSLAEKHTGNLTAFDFPLLCIDFLLVITGNNKSLPVLSLRQLLCQQAPVLVTSSLSFHRLILTKMENYLQVMLTGRQIR